MVKKKINYLIYTCLLFILGIFFVNAKVAIEVANDLVVVKPDFTTIGIHYNTSTNFNSAINIETYGSLTGNRGYVSLKNGSYYFWSRTTNNNYDLTGPLTITKSCNNDNPKLNQTGTFTLERCFILEKGSSTAYPDGSPGTIASCASGYKLTEQKKITDGCASGLSFPNGIKRRYCKVVMSYTCTKNDTGNNNPQPVAAPSLSGLSVSSGSLSPGFSSGTKSYKVTVAADVSSIKVNATPANGSSFVSGYGSRTVNLNYGSNKIQVRVKNSAGTVATYVIEVVRTDNRSNVNTISNLTISEGTLSPAFSSNVNNYNVTVPNETTSIKLDATLTDNTSKFAEGFEPKEYTLQEGTNQLYIKVVSQKGNTNVYNITVIRETTPTRCTTEISSLALLKQIDLSVDIDNLEIDQIEDFSPNVFTYENIKVPYQVTNLSVNAYVNEEGDTVTVEGAEDLEVNVPREIKITVKSKDCPNFTNVYTLNVTRQPQKVLGTNPDLEGITIDDHDEFEFEYSKSEYSLILKKNETSLGINLDKVEEETECVISGNENLEHGSEITIKCTSEDGEQSSEYVITIDGVEKGTNTLLIVILVILIVLVLIYLILRLLGYRIYFNFSAVGAFFRGMGEKAKDTFDK